jgi:signal transduction histidine kinase
MMMVFQNLIGNAIKYRGKEPPHIGLATCKRIIERLGGKVWAESAPGKGSAFYFTLPLSA